jgi:hypothetical protein
MPLVVHMSYISTYVEKHAQRSGRWTMCFVLKLSEKPAKSISWGVSSCNDKVYFQDCDHSLPLPPSSGHRNGICIQVKSITLFSDNSQVPRTALTESSCSSYPASDHWPWAWPEPDQGTGNSSYLTVKETPASCWWLLPVPLLCSLFWIRIFSQMRIESCPSSPCSKSGGAIKQFS